MIDMRQLLQDVERLIYPLRLQNTNRAVFHRKCQLVMATLAVEYSCTAKKEYKVTGVPPSGRNGALDVVWLRDGIPVVVIEIDSSIRQKSINKLMMFKNCQRLWLYYGNKSLEKLGLGLDQAGITVCDLARSIHQAVASGGIEMSHLEVRVDLVGEAMVAKLINFPFAGSYMNPDDLRAIAIALQQAANECELIRQSGLTKSSELYFSISPKVLPHVARSESILDKLAQTFGNRRFGIGELHRLLMPHRHPHFIDADSKRIRQQATEMVKQKIFVESKGPRGGEGWLLTMPSFLSK
jgi:hypothetical protein